MDTNLSYHNILNIHKLNTNINNKSETDYQSDDIECTKYIIKLDSLETNYKYLKIKINYLIQKYKQSINFQYT